MIWSGNKTPATADGSTAWDKSGEIKEMQQTKYETF
jgi:hypothetical protein